MLPRRRVGRTHTGGFGALVNEQEKIKVSTLTTLRSVEEASRKRQHIDEPMDMTVQSRQVRRDRKRVCGLKESRQVHRDRKRVRGPKESRQVRRDRKRVRGPKESRQIRRDRKRVRGPKDGGRGDCGWVWALFGGK